MLTCLIWHRLEESSDWKLLSTNKGQRSSVRPKTIGGENVTTHLTSFVARLTPSSIPVYNLWTKTANSCYASRIPGLQFSIRSRIGSITQTLHRSSGSTASPGQASRQSPAQLASEPNRQAIRLHPSYFLALALQINETLPMCSLPLLTSSPPATASCTKL